MTEIYFKIIVIFLLHTHTLNSMVIYYSADRSFALHNIYNLWLRRVIQKVNSIKESEKCAAKILIIINMKLIQF